MAPKILKIDLWALNARSFFASNLFDMNQFCVYNYYSQFYVPSFYFYQVLYISQLYKDVENEKASIFNMSEFALKEPLLSFSIYVAKERKMKSSSLSGENENGMHALNGDCDEPMGDLMNDENLENTEDASKEKTSVVTLFAVNKM